MKERSRMKWIACFLVLGCMSACVLEDQPVGPGGSGGGTGGTGGMSGAGGACGSCSGDTPACDVDTGRCVECTSDDPAFCVDDTPRCNPDTMMCVACLTMSDCTNPAAARCNISTNECGPCQSASDCTSVEDAPICEDGTCVECTPENENEDCDGRTCNPETFKCTATPIGSVGTCEPCVTDSDCEEEDDRCVEMFYQGARFPDADTGFCLRRTEAGCERPFSITLDDRPSLSGPPTESYCGINETLATCPAVNALLSDARCPLGTDEECPQPGGLCREVGSLQNRCTYECGGLVECLEDIPPGRPGATCGTGDGGEPEYCGG